MMTTLPVHEFETGEDKFHNLISQAPVLISTFKGPSFIVKTVNKMALEIWGKSYEEVINKPLFESSPELEDGLKSLLTAVFTTGEPFISNEIPVQLKRIEKPDTAYFNSVYQPLRDVDNKIYGIILIGTEITESVNARKLIETSDLLSRTILESSPDCLKVLDLEGRIQFINYNGLCQMEIDDFSTLKNKIWCTLWGSENEALVNASISKALKGEIAKFTTFCPTAKGTPKWWDVVVSPVSKQGEAVQKIISVSKDITEQKKSQEAIDKMASHLKLATDSAKVGVWSLNMQTQELEWSALHKKMWGYDGHRTDLTFEDWHKIIIPDDKELALKRVEDAKVNQTQYEVEYRIKRPNDNVIRWVKSFGQYYYNDTGEAITLTGISIDTTEQKESVRALEKMASHLKLATDSAKVGVWSLNLQTQELEWSALHKKMWGYDEHRTELTFEDWHKIILEEDKELAFKRVDDARINHTPYDVEYRIKRPNDNVIRWMKAVGQYYYNSAGEAVTLTGISVDITEQKVAEDKIKVSENQFHTFADSIQNLAWIAKADGWIYWYNQRWYDYTGTTLEKMTRWSWQRVHHPDHLKKVTEFVKEAWKKDEAWELTFPLRRHDGEYRWFLTRAYPVKDINGNIERWIGTNTDVTEQKGFSEELEKKVTERTEELAFRTKQLEEINKTLDLNNLALENANAELKSFSYMASHDLQEPLRMIKMFSKRIIEAEKFSDKTQSYFNFIITASERMRNLIISLIDFSRIDRTELNFIPCNLNTIVEESKSDLQLRIAEKHAIIECENLPTINGMPIQLSQLFTNLIGNSIKYSRHEIIPHIKITSDCIDGKEIDHLAANKQQEYYTIKIADNGIGFEKEYATKIFEVFQRLHTRNEYSGTGIGLSIVKKIVTNHNGFIIAEGEPDVGSTFTLYLPTR